MSNLRHYHSAKKSARSLFIGDDHSAEFWEHNHNAFRKFKPDYLLLEVIGIHRYITSKERSAAKKSYVYMDNKNQPGYNSDAFKLADDLDIPMIGIDTWDEPYKFNDGFNYDTVLSDANLTKSHRIREAQMAKVAKEFLPLGKVLLIVGAEHLRESSELTKLANGNNVDVRFFTI